jgi:hypothetical protein
MLKSRCSSEEQALGILRLVEVGRRWRRCAGGAGNREAAAKLFISDLTVGEAYKRRLLR